MPDRTSQIASVIRVAVQRVITRGLNDPRIRGLISVTNVNVSPDLAQAKVFVSILPAENSDLTMHGLRQAAGHIQSEIAAEVTARRLPRLTFVLDESLKKQAQIEAALARSRSEGPAGDDAASGNTITAPQPDSGARQAATQGPDSHPSDRRGARAGNRSFEGTDS